MKPGRPTALGIFLIGFLLLSPSPYLYAQATPLSAEEWRADLRFLDEQIRERHRNPFHAVTSEAFEKAVSDLHEQIPSLPEHEIIARMAGLVALFQDGHTRFTLPVNHDLLGFYQGHSIDPPPSERISMFHTLPLRFYLFSDGLHVQSATPAHRDVLGAKVLTIGTMTAEQALEAMRPFIASENESGFKFVVPSRLSIPEMLAAARITQSFQATDLVLEDPDGRRITRTLPSLPADAQVEWVDARTRTGAPTPLWLKDPEAFYWFEALPEANALYVQINQIDDNRSPEESAGSFARRVFRYVDEHDIDRIIFDLRHNYGGDATYTRAFLLGLIRWDKIRQPGHFIVITGRKTFSAAILLVNELEQYTHVTFVGEPIGGTPNHYGDSRRTQLPNSNLTLRTSSVYWRDWTGAEQRPFFLNLPVSMAAQDYLQGRDPVLEASLTFQPPTDLAAYLIQADEQGGINTALFLALRMRTDPATADLSMEEAMNAFGFELLKKGRYRHAAGIFTINREGYPNSALAYLGEGEAYVAMEAWPEARQALEKALTLDPDNEKASVLLDQVAQNQ